jgi:hypothetical protein
MILLRAGDSRVGLQYLMLSVAYFQKKYILRSLAK